MDKLDEEKVTIINFLKWLDLCEDARLFFYSVHFCPKTHIEYYPMVDNIIENCIDEYFKYRKEVK